MSEGSGQSAVPELVPARMLNEHVYCPRLAYLEWVDSGFRESADTIEGTFAHRRVDVPRGSPPEPGGDEADDRPPSRSVWLSSPSLGLSAKIDVLESGRDGVIPIEYKRGRPASPESPLRDPERVQLCAQVLLLRDAGYRVDHAEVYFAESRSRHRIEITDALIETTVEAAREIRANAGRDEPPAPLVDSPKCPRCSLVTLCLPDEVGLLSGERELRPRRLVARDAPTRPLYLTEQGGTLTKHQRRLVLQLEGQEVSSTRLLDVAHVAVFGNVTVRSAALRLCFEAGIPVLWFSYGGWFAGFAGPLNGGSVTLRLRQARAATIGTPELAANFVAGKIRNQRTLLRRHGGSDAFAKPLAQLAALVRQAERERNIESLLGIEGTAARIYFAQFGDVLHGNQGITGFKLTERNRRPPRDPVNALLSFTYAMLIKDTLIALVAAGLDPYIGVYHRPRFGRPALALDLAEEFRPLVADSAVLRMVNNGEIGERHFVSRAGAVSLTADGRRRAIAAYERRMADELRHPQFGYTASYRRTIEIQARLLAATLIGDIPSYRPLTTR